MEGSTPTIWSALNRPVSFPELGAFRYFGIVVSSLAQDLKDRDGLDISECFIDGTFVPAKKGALRREDQAWKRHRNHGIADRHGLPQWVCTTSASPAEVKLVVQTLDQRFVADVPQRLIGDKAYDSDGLDEQMMRDCGTEVIAPHRSNCRPENVTPDWRALRRYTRRWKTERLFA